MDLQWLSIIKNLQVSGSLHYNTHTSCRESSQSSQPVGANHNFLKSADADALLELIDEYPKDPEGIAPPINPTFWLYSIAITTLINTQRYTVQIYNTIAM